MSLTYGTFLNWDSIYYVRIEAQKIFPQETMEKNEVYKEHLSMNTKICQCHAYECVWFKISCLFAYF